MIVTYADPTSIYLSGGGIADYLTFYYNINYQGKLAEGNSNVVVTIYDQDGNKVYYFSDTKPEGNYSKQWGGENNVTGGTVPDGTYNLQIVSSDPTGTIYSYITNLTVASGSEENGSALTVADNGITEPIITPNGDGQQDETIIKYQVENAGNSIGSIEVNIYNSATTFDAATLVKTLSGSVNGDTIWDGSVNVKGGNGDADGNGYADKGLYKYVITASDLLGNVKTCVSTYEIQVDKVYLSFVVQTINPDNRYFSPNGDGIKDTATISYMLTTTQESNPHYAQVKAKNMKTMASSYNVGKVTVKVKNMAGSSIKTIMTSVPCVKDLTYVATWDGTNDSNIKVADAPYTIEVTAVDMINDPANNMEISCEVDTTPPVVSFTQPAEYSFHAGTFDINGTISDIHPGTYSVYRQGAVIGSGSGNKSDEKLTSFDTYGLNGDYPVYLIATDEAGNTSAVATRHFYVDNTPPIISQPTSEAGGVMQTFFNPYTDSQISIEAPVSDESFDTSVFPIQSQPHSISASAEVYLNNTLIRNLSSSTLNSNGQLNLLWDGKNLDGDYVNEGDYTVSISAVDSNGNVSSTYEYTCSLKDDQPLTTLEGASYSHDPNLKLDSSGLNIRLITGDNWGDTTYSNRTFYTTDGIYGRRSDWDYVEYFRGDFEIEKAQNIHVHTYAYFDSHGDAYHYTYDINDNDVLPLHKTSGSQVNGWGWTYDNDVAFDQGRYYTFLEFHPANDHIGHISTVITYSAPEYNNKLMLDTRDLSLPGSRSSISEIKTLEASASNLDGSVEHDVWSSRFFFPQWDRLIFPNNNKEIVYEKKENGILNYGETSSGYDHYFYPNQVRLSSAEGDSINPSVATDSTGNNVYVVWEDHRNNNGQIYYRTSTTSGESWNNETLLVSSGNCSNPSLAMSGDNIFIAYIDNVVFPDIKVIKSVDGGVHWTTPVRITRNEFSGSQPTKPSIVCDSSGNAYVAWEDTRTGTSEVFFQKVPSNFAPFSGSTMTTMSMPKGKPAVETPVVIQSTSSTIELIGPLNGTTVKSLRPTFKWYGVQNVPDYRIECAATSDADALNNTMDYFTATITDVSAAKPVCEYVVPEHSIGLDENDQTKPYWYWRVNSVTTEATTSEVGSFKIELPASVSGVTNWPNPFDPNKETTKIRYKLGREPNSVIIRIYDITGRLVKEMDGTTNPEGANIMDKYNDVEWDGRNGRGDMVVNGVYPFEITVNYGNKTELGRGKIVVLK
jgi:flagellar hook assembly protein FlgD